MSVHPTAQAGFGSDSSNYDNARPDHQPPAVNHLLQNLHIPPGGRLVEIGSGTGKFTSHLLNRPEKWEIICVEPSHVILRPRTKVMVGYEGSS
jgi:ubiquinone/menaquinone biosynthesis C-methylase UbiE